MIRLAGITKHYVMGDEEVRALDGVDELQGPAHHVRLVARGTRARGRLQPRPRGRAAAAPGRRVELLTEHGEEVAHDLGAVPQHLLHDRHRVGVAVDAGLERLEGRGEVALPAEPLGE